ncbi:hypothetical protein LTR48_000708 [Friedmanniomyces endolithicus]|uniref:Glutamine synthetase n=1 Tax=Rachicladosporium monterosium TaxID=1507873 RepID=A0ABR0LHF9_9PEZI|nr:hypothetical protein LTR48_000708 [Friedmanniomyces endolithicus]KAK5147976.1 hypothetical protein LTR32_000665 [Rachicladosporium monterosium]
MPFVNGERKTVAGHDGSRSPYDPQKLTRFTTEHPDIQFVVVQWLDYLGTLRSRWLPIDAFDRLVKAGNRIGISKGNLGTLQNDKTTSVCDPVGQILVEPDLDSLRIMQTKGMIGPAASTCMARFVDNSMRPLSLCPRSQLQGFIEMLEQDYHINLLVGFEIEVTFCRRGALGPNGHFAPLDSNHAWGTLSDEQLAHAFPLMAAISLELRGMGIEIEQLHSESGAGQYEFVLPPLPPVQAVDTLVQARQCIQQIAAAQGLRATYHPQPFPGIGTAAHAHVSLNSGSLTAEELEKTEKSFWASVLAHLPALCAFTMPQAGSYGRVVDDSWTNGTWVAWGTQNREVPLRRVETYGVGNGSRWEVRCLDGLANMYLALGAVVGAGLHGVRNGYRHRAVRTTSPRWAGSHLDGALFLGPLPAVLSPLAAGQQSPPQPDDRKRKRTLPSAPLPDVAADEPAPKRHQRAVSPPRPDDPTTTTTVPSQPPPPPPPIPDDILALANTVKHLPITRMGRTLGHGFPSRNVLRTCAALEGETSRKTGCLMVGKRGGRLRAWRGDERLFSGEWWGYLCVEGWERGVVGEGKAVGGRKTWNSGSVG